MHNFVKNKKITTSMSATNPKTGIKMKSILLTILFKIIGVRVKLKHTLYFNFTLTPIILWKQISITIGTKRDKKGTSMILCFYRQELETFKENHKIIDVPFFTCWEQLSCKAGSQQYKIFLEHLYLYPPGDKKGTSMILWFSLKVSSSCW